MNRLTAIAVLLYCGWTHADEPQALERGGLAVLKDAEMLPADFESHFFDVPLATRIEVNGALAGDATVVLTKSGTVQLLEFTEVGGSKLEHGERERWAAYLRESRPLGPCATGCDNDLVAMYYSLENSKLSIVTTAAEKVDGAVSYFSLPKGGSSGAILRNYINAYSGDGQQQSGRYALDAQGSVGLWTTVGNLQVDKSSIAGSREHYSMQSLYARREIENHFVSAGFFTPNFDGVTRQPRSFGGRVSTTVGVMAGSSDNLLVDAEQPSLYPVYVTANRQGTLEIYRNGVLINTQPMQPGLQLVDTRPLPGGVYQVEIRMIEDGNVTSREEQLIYKPRNWSNLDQPWRYSVFAGQQRNLLDSSDDGQSGDLAAGAMFNYLLHPRVVLGLGAQQIGPQTLLGSSLDWDISERVRMFGNVYHTPGYGTGFDLQGMYSYNDGSVVFNYNRAWLDVNERDVYRDPLNTRPIYSAPNFQRVETAALSLQHRLNNKTSLSARVSHSSGGTVGTAIDLGLSRRTKVLGNDASWRVAAFDRPGTSSTVGQRSRGGELSLSLSLGNEGRQYSGSVGSRTASEGGRDQYASFSVQQQVENSWLQSVSGTTTADSYGVGLSGRGDFEHRLFRGDAYAQRSSLTNGVSAGLNLESTVAIGDSQVAVSGVGYSADTGIIVDVESDLPELKIRADDSGGNYSKLSPGRNFIPVAAYQSGAVMFDFDGSDAPAASIHPSSTGYHLNKGGVAYQKVRIMKTLTVMGKVLGFDGEPLKGAHVVNHAGRTVTEADGFFAIEMSESTPTLEVTHPQVKGCQFELAKEAQEKEHGMNTLMVGELRCEPNRLASSDLSVKR